MDRWHEGRGSFWWVAAACLLVACGGRSGELYNDSVSTMTGGFGTGGGGKGGDGGNGGNGGFGGSGGSDNFGGDGGSLSFGGSGGIPFGGSGGVDVGGNGGSNNFGGSGGNGGNGGNGGFGGSGGGGGSNNFGGSGGDGGSNNFGGSGGDGGSATGGPLECVGCVAQSCPFVVACAQDPVCLQRILCTFNECFEDGLDFECVIECHDGELDAALALIDTLSCATMTCGDRCNFDQ